MEAKLKLTPEEATSIIIEAKNADAYDGALPEEDEKKVKLAEELAYYALKAFINDHDRSDIVRSILSIARIEVEDDIWLQVDEPTTVSDTNDKTKVHQTLLSKKVSDVISAFESLEAEEIRAIQELERNGKGRRGITDYEIETIKEHEKLDDELDGVTSHEPVESVIIPDELPELVSEDDWEKERKEITEIKKTGLPIPPDIPDEEAPDLLYDFSDLDEDELMRSHAKFNACLASANWLLANKLIDENFFREIADHRAIKNRRKVVKIDPDTHKVRPAAIIDQEKKEASEEDNVLEARVQQNFAKRSIIGLEKLVKTYETTLATISRQWSYRERMLEHGGRLAPRSS